MHPNVLEGNNLLNKRRRRFFALGRELGYDSQVLKERAKKHFNEKDTFNNLKINQLEILINKMEVVKIKKYNL